jgi:hypothetical protein
MNSERERCGNPKRKSLEPAVVYHPVRTKAEYLRESSGWYRQQREKDIFLRAFWVLAFAVFAFLVLD